MKKDIDKIKHTYFITEGKFIIHVATVGLYYLDYPKKRRGGEKNGYIVSCLDTTAKDGEQEAFCKRIRTKKDANKYFRILPNYCKNFGKDGLMKIWDEVDKSFDYKITLNKDYTICPRLVVDEVKNNLTTFFQQKVLD